MLPNNSSSLVVTYPHISVKKRILNRKNNSSLEANLIELFFNIFKRTEVLITYVVLHE